MFKSSVALLALSLALPVTANAAIVTLTFEGIGNLNPVGDFYAAQGIIFSDDTLAVIDADAGGTGNIANEPSASTVMFFLNSNNAVLNVAAGFETGFSFFYSSSTAATVNVWSEVGATGTLLGSIDLTAQFSNNCTGDPNGQFCNWTPIGVAFEGLARSIDFGGTANQTAFDNITFGSERPTQGAIPEPGSWAMMIAGFGLVGATARRRRYRARIAFAD
ncbi:PEPxxWA-CTERM sorting domain-containing protein [Edaphosphingomonas fennica]|nr:hypothetical protein G432_14335 [Sphingomonas sp. MM-1]